MRTVYHKTVHYRYHQKFSACDEIFMAVVSDDKLNKLAYWQENIVIEVSDGKKNNSML